MKNLGEHSWTTSDAIMKGVKNDVNPSNVWLLGFTLL